MKTRTLLTVLAFALIFIKAASFSQAMTEYTWNSYNVKFKIPKTFSVSESSGSTFSAGDDDAWLTIYPRTGENLSYNKMKKNLKEWAANSGVSGYGSVYDESVNGYWGVYLNGTKSDNGLPAYLGLLVHPDYPDVSMYVWINYRSDALDVAQKIFNSFSPTY